MRRTSFTLLELVAVMAIIAVATSLAVSSFRGESPARKVENTSLEFASWCAQVRYSAMESGTERIVSFSPDEQKFFAQDSAQNLAQNVDASEPIDEKPPKEWRLPEEFELDPETLIADMSEGGTIEIFRFFPDGSANASREFLLKFKNLQRRFRVSPLTGMLLQSEEAIL
ncbi:MAG: prepilin-type N-terminal cleavage/methylation domain-containing protein [Victivallales bacterium]|jgi:prepilin-type N-terminal cleavage/methylation domain-containing protein|nr:prepilin-type N-terminal cleavage/methylation domain-containing protein [Victivallales bacterium]